MSRLRKSIQPFYWQPITLAFTNGTAASVNLATFLVNPQGRTVSYAVAAGALPSGCTLSGSTVSYNGSGAVASSQVQFSATQGSYTAESALTTATIVAGQVTDTITWSLPANLGTLTEGVGGSFNVAPYVTDSLGHALTITRVAGSAPASVTVSTSGTVTVPSSVAAGTYTLQFQASDGLGVAPAAPAGLTVGTVTYASVALSWTASSGATSYLVQRSTDGSTWAARATVSTTGFTDTTVGASTTYYYRVAAANANGTSAYTASVSATTPPQPVFGSYETDWTNRATGAGVLWAHRFNAADAQGLYWGQGQSGFYTGSTKDGRRVGYLSDSVTQTGASGTRSDPGPSGWGCMEMYYPSGTSTGTMSWSRPVAPILQYPARVKDFSGNVVFVPNSTTGDVNNRGLERLDWAKFYTGNEGDPINKEFNGGGGIFCNPADYATYQRAVPANANTTAANEITYSGADGFYIQFRVKYKTLPNGLNRLDYAEAPYGPTPSKAWIAGNISNAAPNHEIVSVIRPGPASATGGGNTHLDNAHAMYGAIGAWWYGDTNRSPNSYNYIQPGYVSSNTTTNACSITNQVSCWKYPKDKWLTFLIHIVPGKQNPPPTSGWDHWLANIATYYDGGIEVWVSDEDRIAAGLGYLKIHQGLNKYAWYYDAAYPSAAAGSQFSLAGTAQAPGFSIWKLFHYSNYNSTNAQNTMADWWIIYDQIICSTDFIPCPTV